MIYLNILAEADILHQQAQTASSIARFDEAESLFSQSLEVIGRYCPQESELFNLQASRILRDRALLCGRRAIILAANPKDAVASLEEACALAEEARDQISFIHDFVGTSEVRDELAHSISTLGGLVLATEVCIAPDAPATQEAQQLHWEANEVLQGSLMRNSYYRSLNLMRWGRALLTADHPELARSARRHALAIALAARTIDPDNFHLAYKAVDTRFEDLNSPEAAIASLLRKTPHTATGEIVNI